MSNYNENKNSCKPEISICQLEINPENNKQRAYLKNKKNYILEIYDQDIKIKTDEITKKILKSRNYIKKFGKGKQTKGGIKQKIKNFSTKSQKNLKFFMNNSRIDFKNMITLTYPNQFPTDGKKVKYDLNRFTKFLKSKKSEYVWVIEFQKRGAPHFHILTDKFIDKKIVSEEWFKIVNSKDEKHLLAGTKVEKLRRGKKGAKSYIRKYVNKQEQKNVPEEYEDVGRFWGKSAEKLVKEEYELGEKESLIIKSNYELKFRSWLENKVDEEKLEIIINNIYESDNIIIWSFRKETLEIIETLKLKPKNIEVINSN